MTEPILYISVGIFLAVWLSLLPAKEYQINCFFLLSLLVLSVISMPTVIGLISFSSACFGIAYCFIQTKNKVVIFAGIAFCISVFFIFQQLHVESSSVIFIGVIYVVCRQVHFLIETLTTASLPCNYFQYLRYQCFLPCLIAGPIHRVDDFEKEIRRRKVTLEKISCGLERVVWGHFKVIVVAGALLSLVRLHLSKGLNESVLTLTSSFFDWINLYVVFSGFADIAIGFSLMLGIKIAENFNYPFVSQNINEFWQRWHISLSQWCKHYVFTPSLAVTRSLFIASLFSMVVIGLWHEFSFRYVLWGIYHATGLIAFQWYCKQAWRIALPKPIAVVFTLTFVISSYPITSFINQFIMQLLG
ncbi:MBOAT family O-acyltransferase [Shewanella donghaensis]|uniref:MBOAT family O-acyltransferase n=1 Tax=Shewanella donghaensis TaxID=238836 RepID=UPI0011835761|nr:MBOAT family O-acyltransferase [Shewanella donghaensis]